VELNRKLRLLGVRVSALTPANAQTPKPRLPVQADLPFASDE
jgi:DNA polymerase-4